MRAGVRADPRVVHTLNMGGDVSRNGKIGAGVVLFLVLAVVAVLAVGSAVGWYDEERPQSLGPPPGHKERVSTSSLFAGRSRVEESFPLAKFLCTQRRTPVQGCESFGVKRTQFFRDVLNKSCINVLLPISG